MTFQVVERPDVDFDAVDHVYSIGGERVAGVSSVAKLGGAEDSFGIASAWGFRVGYEGAFDVAHELVPRDEWPESKDTLRAILKQRGLTPWAQRDRAGKRGTAVHDALEELAQNDVVPVPDRFAADEQGHVRSVLRWYLHYRPRFVATEVQVASRTHLFAGRYDLRVLIPARLLLPLIRPERTDPAAERIRVLAARGELALCLVDLKTSKRIYPETHFPQLSGYELAGVEMGFPATDCQIVLNTNEDGTFRALPERNEYGDEVADMAVSWSQPEDFVGLLEAYRAIKRLKAADPEAIAEKTREGFLLGVLPARSRELAALAEAGGAVELSGMDAKAIGRALGKLAKAGKCQKGERGLWLPAA